jgi:Ras-related protein Rab-8A
VFCLVGLFDFICSPHTGIRNWLRNIEQHVTQPVIKILIGNKCDLVDDRVIETERGQALAEEYNMEFFETSCKCNINVNESFLSVVKSIKRQLIDKSESHGDETNRTFQLQSRSQQPINICGC